ncbi:hypothetical protein BUALT_Bualt09G0105700 [Buddleja alternifolia]|uniref:Uncharacterized protein n=1 Tax=Buddleja alternifolia TaxID=168488 RepID=A0AAV6XC69_9LAMI|nr:hypothetical protein BUALT_Bualt09G0105700 [Buddleja alternifolia]
MILNLRSCLAAAAAMGRTHGLARREGTRSRPSAHARPQFMVFSANPNASSADPILLSSAPSGAETEPAVVTNPSVPLISVCSERMSSSVQSNQLSGSSSGYLVMPTTCQGISNDNILQQITQ